MTAQTERRCAPTCPNARARPRSALFSTRLRVHVCGACVRRRLIDWRIEDLKEEERRARLRVEQSSNQAQLAQIWNDDDCTPRTLVSCEHVHALETQLTRDKRILRPEPGGSTWRAQSSILARAVLHTSELDGRGPRDGHRSEKRVGVGESGTEDGRRRINTHFYKKYERYEPRAPPTVRV